jgi:hypothetical protein
MNSTVKLGAILILFCSLAYGADEKTSGTPEATRKVVDKDLPNGRGHIHVEEFYRGKTRVLGIYQKTVAGQTKTERAFVLGDVTVYETEDDGDGRFKSVVLCNDKTKQLEGFVGKRDGTAVPFDAKTLAATKEQFDAISSFWSETLGKGASIEKFREAAKALQEELKESEKNKSQGEK